MSTLRELGSMRADIRARVGPDALAALHRESVILDAVGVLACWGSVAALFVLLAWLPFGLPWVLCFVAQGIALQTLGLLSHDAFMHRRIWGDAGSWVGAMVSSFPVLLRPTWYVINHADHHAYLGTERDTETYKQTLDTVWKRLFFLTAAGDRMAKLGRLSKSDIPMRPVVARTSTEARRLKLETGCLTAFLLVVGACSVVWPRTVLAGYVLPLLLVTPVVSSLRVILEHADADPTNRFHLGTYYRTGMIARLLFVADSGDCHLVHHIFSQIPWYRMGRAVRLMRPVLIERGVVERRSLTQLLLGWFVRAYPHRTLWFPPAG